MKRLPESDEVARVREDWQSLNHFRSSVLMVGTAGGIYLCWRLAEPFLAAIVWAITLAVLFAPLQVRLEAVFRRAGLSAAISVTLIGAVLLGLLTVVGERLMREANTGTALVKTRIESGVWRQALASQRRLAPIMIWWQNQDFSPAAEFVTASITKAGSSVVRGSVVKVIGVFACFYFLFYFLRDRDALLRKACSFSPLSAGEMRRLLGRVGDTIHATVYGTFAVAAVQGVLGGLMFWWLGLPGALLWGSVMALLAVVPVLGAFVVWIPAVLFLALEGSWGKALILMLWGGLVVGTIDNLLRPILVGDRLRLHTILVFISVVGGLILFGPSGLILGPVALTTTEALLEIWRDRTHPESQQVPERQPKEI